MEERGEEIKGGGGLGGGGEVEEIRKKWRKGRV